jgi:hypothetical protein
VVQQRCVPAALDSTARYYTFLRLRLCIQAALCQRKVVSKRGRVRAPNGGLEERYCIHVRPQRVCCPPSLHACVCGAARGQASCAHPSAAAQPGGGTAHIIENDGVVGSELQRSIVVFHGQLSKRKRTLSPQHAQRTATLTSNCPIELARPAAFVNTWVLWGPLSRASTYLART